MCIRPWQGRARLKGWGWLSENLNQKPPKETNLAMDQPSFDQ